MRVARRSDEVWIAVKCQSNLAIAGSPRNVLQDSLKEMFINVNMDSGRGRALSSVPEVSISPLSLYERQRDGYCSGSQIANSECYQEDFGS